MDVFFAAIPVDSWRTRRCFLDSSRRAPIVAERRSNKCQEHWTESKFSTSPITSRGRLRPCCSATWARKSTRSKRPERGDPFRTWDKEPKDYSPSFCGVNRNKKSVTLDMKTPEGKEIFLRLAKDADVIVENLRPGVVDRLGIGYEDIKKFNPQIIYCSISAFGQEGPYRQKTRLRHTRSIVERAVEHSHRSRQAGGTGRVVLGSSRRHLRLLRRSCRHRGAAANRQGPEGRNFAVGSDDQLHRLQHHPVSFQRRRAEEEQSVENRRCVRLGRRGRQAVCDSSVPSAEILDRRHRSHRAGPICKPIRAPKTATRASSTST